MSNVAPQVSKKPLTKRWWFWAIVVFAVLALLGALGGSPDEDPQTTTTAAESTLAEDSATAETSEPEQEAEATESEETAEEISSAASETDAELATVKFGGQEWTCLPAPEDLLERLLDGSSYNVGDLAVDKATMVQGVDNFFVATDVIYPDDKTPFTAVFTSPIDGTGPITSATKGTSQLFNWPETPGGKLDGAYAAEKCLKKV